MPTGTTPVNANIDALYNRTVVDQSGDKIGEIGQVYLDDASGQPAWVTVKTSDATRPLCRSEGSRLPVTRSLA